MLAYILLAMFAPRDSLLHHAMPMLITHYHTLTLPLSHRYLLLTRGGMPVTEEDLTGRAYCMMGDDLAAVHVSVMAGWYHI